MHLVYILSITTIVGVIVGIREIIVDVAEQSSYSSPYLPIMYYVPSHQASGTYLSIRYLGTYVSIWYRCTLAN